MSFRDLDTRLTPRELDDAKHAATVAMAAARDAMVWELRGIVERAYNAAHLELLGCQTEGKVARIESDFRDFIKCVGAAIEGALK